LVLYRDRFNITSFFVTNYCRKAIEQLLNALRVLLIKVSALRADEDNFHIYEMLHPKVGVNNYSPDKSNEIATLQSMCVRVIDQSLS
jgi:hypothetical protein